MPPFGGTDKTFDSVSHKLLFLQSLEGIRLAAEMIIRIPCLPDFLSLLIYAERDELWDSKSKKKLWRFSIRSTLSYGGSTYPTRHIVSLVATNQTFSGITFFYFFLFTQTGHFLGTRTSFVLKKTLEKVH